MKTAHFSLESDDAYMQRVYGCSKKEWKARTRALKKYVKAIDAIYNHNEAARAAVIQHFGTLHDRAALDELKGAHK